MTRLQNRKLIVFMVGHSDQSIIVLSLDSPSGINLVKINAQKLPDWTGLVKKQLKAMKALKATDLLYIGAGETRPYPRASGAVKNVAGTVTSPPDESWQLLQDQSTDKKSELTIVSFNNEAVPYGTMVEAFTGLLSIGMSQDIVSAGTNSTGVAFDIYGTDPAKKTPIAAGRIAPPAPAPPAPAALNQPDNAVAPKANKNSPIQCITTPDCTGQDAADRINTMLSVINVGDAIAVGFSRKTTFMRDGKVHGNTLQYTCTGGDSIAGYTGSDLNSA